MYILQNANRCSLKNPALEPTYSLTESYPNTYVVNVGFPHHRNQETSVGEHMSVWTHST